MTEMDALLTVKEIASFLGVSPSTIRRLERSGELPSLRGKGLGVRFRRDEVDSWLENKRANPDYRLCLPAGALTSPPVCFIKKSHGQTGGIREMPKGKTKSRHNFGFGAVYVRKSRSGSPRYYLDYTDQGRRIQRVCRRATSYEDAYLELRQAVFKEPEKKRMAFDAFANLYLEAYSKPNNRSWRSDESRLGRLKMYFRETDLRLITPLGIEKFRADLLERDLERSTTNRYIALLKRMFNVAIDEGFMEANPARKIRLFSEADHVKERILTEDEEGRLIASCCDHMKEIVTFALNTGMRLGEILNLKWANVDLKLKTIRVEFTKSAKTRVVPMNETLTAMFSRPGRKVGEYVFAKPDSLGRYYEVKRSFATGCRKAGISGLRFHDLRHTFASRLVRNGVDIGVVRKLLGHSTLLVTQRYVHPDGDSLRRAVGSLVKPGDLLHRRDTLGRENSRTEESASATIDGSMN